MLDRVLLFSLAWDRFQVVHTAQSRVLGRLFFGCYVVCDVIGLQGPAEPVSVCYYPICSVRGQLRGFEVVLVWVLRHGGVLLLDAVASYYRSSMYRTRAHNLKTITRGAAGERALIREVESWTEREMGTRGLSLLQRAETVVK